LSIQSGYSTVVSDGNTKLGRIANVNLPPVTTCIANAPCAKEGLCYSLKAWNQYPNVRDARRYNLQLWEIDPYWYFKSIDLEIAKKKYHFLRWHSDGDIPNLDYLNRMKKLAEENLGTRFLAFTKKYHFVVDQKFPPNLTVIPSAWPAHPLPTSFERIAWMLDGREQRHLNREYFECSGHCEDCYKCWYLYENGKDVVFHKH